MPTLLVWAANDGALGPQLLRGTERHVEKLRIVTIPDCSHWVTQDRHERTHTRMGGWACMHACDGEQAGRQEGGAGGGHLAGESPSCREHLRARTQPPAPPPPNCLASTHDKHTLLLPCGRPEELHRLMREFMAEQQQARK